MKKLFSYATILFCLSLIPVGAVILLCIYAVIMVIPALFGIHSFVYDTDIISNLMDLSNSLLWFQIPYIIIAAVVGIVKLFKAVPDGNRGFAFGAFLFTAAISAFFIVRQLNMTGVIHL